MKQYRIFLAVNNNVLNAMHTTYVISPLELWDAGNILCNAYPELSAGWSCSIVNDTTRCVVLPNLVAIVEAI
jgi:hypothetical protein